VEEMKECDCTFWMDKKCDVSFLEEQKECSFLEEQEGERVLSREGQGDVYFMT
jgi:hypothetical protein